MHESDPRLTAALRQQLAHRAEVLRGGAQHVGWKLGVGTRERLRGSRAVGHITSATCFADGARDVPVAHDATLRADVELALELAGVVDPDGSVDAARAAIGGYGAALEIVDLAPVLDSPVAIVASNVFHRAVAFGPFLPRLPEGELTGTARVDGLVCATATATGDPAERLLTVARALAAAGERLQAGDRLITGSIVHVPVTTDEEVVAEVSGLGAVHLTLRAT